MKIDTTAVGGVRLRLRCVAGRQAYRQTDRQAIRIYKESVYLTVE